MKTHRVRATLSLRRACVDAIKSIITHAAERIIGSETRGTIRNSKIPRAGSVSETVVAVAACVVPGLKALRRKAHVARLWHRAVAIPAHRAIAVSASDRNRVRTELSVRTVREGEEEAIGIDTVIAFIRRKPLSDVSSGNAGHIAHLDEDEGIDAAK